MTKPLSKYVLSPEEETDLARIKSETFESDAMRSLRLAVEEAANGSAEAFAALVRERNPDVEVTGQSIRNLLRGKVRDPGVKLARALEPFGVLVSEW